MTTRNPPPTPLGGPKPRITAKLVPIGVFAALAAVIGWTAWPLLKPARAVNVAQVVFDRSTSEASPAMDAVDGNDPARAPAREIPTVQAPGWLEAEPFLTAATTLADGIIETIDVLEGDYVEQGQVIARLVDEDARLRLHRAEAELANARAAFDLATAEQRAAERNWADPVDLERAVESNRAALAESEAELAQLPAFIEAATATLIRLEEETSRITRSTAREATNDFELINARQHEAAQRAQVEALEARRPILESRIARLRAEVTAAERNLELRIEDRRRVDAANAMAATAAAGVDRAEAIRDEAQLELERMTIRAPISGFVQSRLKVPGDKAFRMMDSPHSAHILHLYDPDRLQVRVDVPLADASHIYVGQTCEIVVEVLPDRTFLGEVLRVTHEADIQKNTLQIKVKVIDPDPVLRPEMLTRVKFLPPNQPRNDSSTGATARRPSVLIPAAAIDSGPAGDRVWLITDRNNDRGSITARPIDILNREGQWLTVNADLNPGDLLAIGLDTPSEGEHVVIIAQPAADGGQPS